MVKLVEFLTWLVGPGVEVAVGVVLAFIAESWPRYQELSPKAKRNWFMGVCMVVPLFGATVGAALGYWVWDLETTFWFAAQAGAVVYISSQAAHARYLKK